MYKKPNAIICDVDGTLVDVSSLRHWVIGTRNPDGTYKTKDFRKFHEGAINCPPIHDTVKQVREHAAEGTQIIIVTARSQIYGRQTGFWLAMHDVPSDVMFMRKEGDYRKDVLVKTDIWNVIKHRYQVIGAIDDNPSIVELWESLGIPTTVVPGWQVD